LSPRTLPCVLHISLHLLPPELVHRATRRSYGKHWLVNLLLRLTQKWGELCMSILSPDSRAHHRGGHASLFSKAVTRANTKFTPPCPVCTISTISLYCAGHSKRNNVPRDIFKRIQVYKSDVFSQISQFLINPSHITSLALHIRIPSTQKNQRIKQTLWAALKQLHGSRSSRSSVSQVNVNSRQL
jgi:hypothetical protein